MKRCVYRPGDVVRIVEPVFVERVGYPLTWPMLLEEFENNPKIDEAMQLLGLALGGRERQDFIRGVCQAAVRTRRFGGKERSLHTRTDEQARGETSEIHLKRTVYTGTYYPPSGDYSSWSGEYDYEPGGLENSTAHVLLSTDWGEIEQIHCELVEARKQS